MQGGSHVTASDLRIRPFDPGDLPALQHVRRAAFEPVFQSFRGIVGAEIAAFADADVDVEQAKLLEDICIAGSGHHVQVVTVGTGGDPSHAPTQRAYEKAGFGPVLPSIHLYKLL
jgi:hypothetical protein